MATTEIPLRVSPHYRGIFDEGETLGIHPPSPARAPAILDA